jgi:hypothetical protein
VLQLSSNQFTGQTMGTIYSKIATRSWKGSSSGEFANDDIWIQVERQDITNPGNNFTHDAGLVVYTNSNNRDNQPTKRITINQSGLFINSGTISAGTLNLSSGITTGTINAATLVSSANVAASLITTGTINAATLVSSANVAASLITTGTINAATLVSSVNLSGLNITAGTLRAATLVSSVNLSGLNITAGTIRASGVGYYSDNITFPLGKGISLSNSYRTNNGSYALYADSSALSIRVVGSSDSGTQRLFQIGHFSSDDASSTWNSQVSVNTYNGNTGIGTASPGVKLDVDGGAASSASFRINSSAGDSTLSLRNTSAAGREYWIGSAGTGAGAGSGNLYFFDNTASALRMVIGSSGNLGIGTASPAFKLDVAGGSGTIARFYSSISNLTTHTIIQNGAIGIGIGSSSVSYLLQLGSDSAAKPSTNTWTISSDARLKTNITMANLDTCYDNVKNIPLKRYTWLDEVYTAEQVPDRSKLGWIAQDVETYLPKSVEQKEMHGYSDCRTLNSDQIIASMYGALQKLIAKVEELENRLNQ